MVDLDDVTSNDHSSTLREHEDDDESEPDSVSADTAPDWQLQRTDSRESVYMQCYDAGPESSSQSSRAPSRMSNTSSEFGYYRPTRSSCISMDRLRDSQGDTTSFYQVYGTAGGAPGPRPRRRSGGCVVDFEGDTDSVESCETLERDSGHFDMGTPRTPRTPRDTTGHPGTPRDTSVETGSHSTQYSATARVEQSDPHDDRADCVVDHLNTNNNNNNHPGLYRTSGISLQEHQAGSKSTVNEPQTPYTQSEYTIGDARRESSDIADGSNEAGHRASDSTAAGGDGELGLDSLLTSKTERMDKAYKEKGDEDNAPDDNTCMWVFFKLFTWTLLVLVAAATVITAKLSAIVMTQAMFTHLNISAYRLSLLQLTQLNQTNQTFTTSDGVSTTMSVIVSSSNTTNVSFLDSNSTSYLVNQSFLMALENFTANQTELDGCDSVYLSTMSSGTQLLTSYVYSDRQEVYIDCTVILMWMMLLLVPPFLGILRGVFNFVRWESIRRAKLNCRSIFTTVFASIIEVTGVAWLLFEVLPEMNAAWGLFVPSLIMVLPSFARLCKSTPEYNSKAKKLVAWLFVLVPNGIVFAGLFLINGGLLLEEEAHPKLYWILPVSVLLISGAWMPAMLTSQVQGTYKADELDNLDVLGGPERLSEVKTIGLRAKQELLSNCCQFVLYPLAVVGVIVLSHGPDALLSIQAELHGTWTSLLLHHPMLPWFVLNMVGTAFSPIAICVVFSAAIEVKVRLGKDTERPVSGTFIVLVLTFIATVCLAVFNVPYVTCLSTFCCPAPSLTEILLLVSAGILLFMGNFPVIYNVMIANHVIYMPVHKIFTVSRGNALLMDPWLWVNITSSSLTQREKIPDFTALRQKSKIYICTTMYREEENEMLDLLKSIKRINDSRSPLQPLYEAHLYFDAAIATSSEGSVSFNGFALQLLALVERTFNTVLDEFDRKSTPYGIQCQVPLRNASCDKPMLFYIHFKDNAKVKKKKRWSQIMYMVWAIEHEAEVPVEDRYVLITDGDTKFYEKGPVALLDALLTSPEAAAVVGRVRPIITANLLVLYQVFEYAASFWIYKASNDQLGTDLCCSGCFTLYRGSMLKGVLKDYATDATNAQDFLMIDMGEDLWLSTLLIRSGYKLNYSSVADVFTRAPGNLEEYFKQRRRWYLSSLAYFFFFIRQLSRFKFGNRHVTMPFLFYQGMLLCFPLISTSTLGLVLAIAQAHAFHIPLAWSCTIVVVIFVLQHFFCLFFPSSVQIKASALLSILPSVAIVGIVFVVMMNVYNDFSEAFTPINGTTPAVDRVLREELPFPLPSAMISTLILLLLATGLLHPKEFYYIFYVVIYIIGSPLGYIFLRPYMLCNVTDQSWGTRELKTKEPVKAASFQEKLRGFCQAMTGQSCCTNDSERQVAEIISGTVSPNSADSSQETRPNSQGANSDQISSEENISTMESGQDVSLHTSQFSGTTTERASKLLFSEMENLKVSDEVMSRMVALRKVLNLRMRCYTSAVDKEDRFWERIIQLKLSNVDTESNKRVEENVHEGLRSFQRRILIVYLVLNILWIVALSVFWVFIRSSITETSWGRYFNMMAIIAVPYLIINIIQFIAMFIHRMKIWLYLLARTKCRVGDVLMCGYPTNYDPQLHDDVTPASPPEPGACATRHHYVTRASSRNVSEMADLQRSRPSSGVRVSSSDGELFHIGFHRTDEEIDSRMCTLPSPLPQSSLYLSGTPQQLPRFRGSHWLPGNTDPVRGPLELQASQDSLNDVMVARGSGGGQGSPQWERLSLWSDRDRLEGPPVHGKMDSWLSIRNLRIPRVRPPTTRSRRSSDSSLLRSSSSSPAPDAAHTRSPESGQAHFSLPRPRHRGDQVN